jgi:DNA-binding NtrC family response regulator
MGPASLGTSTDGGCGDCRSASGFLSRERQTHSFQRARLGGFHVVGALAEFERNLIRERTLAEPKSARARGRTGGRPRKLSAKELKMIAALLKTPEVSVQEIANRYGVSRSTLYRNGVA